MLQKKSFCVQQEGAHLYPTTGPNSPKWYVIDVKDMVVGRVASMIAQVVTGKHKATYTPHADTGDFVVVLNCEKVVFTRGKLDGKLYRDYSGYISGLKTKTAREMLAKKPEEVIRRAVWGMTGKSSLARQQMKKLKIYVGSEHPHAAQNPKTLPPGVLRRQTRPTTTKTKTA